jgi:hypothetical protein
MVYTPKGDFNVIILQTTSEKKNIFSSNARKADRRKIKSGHLSQ